MVMYEYEIKWKKKGTKEVRVDTECAPTPEDAIESLEVCSGALDSIQVISIKKGKRLILSGKTVIRENKEDMDKYDWAKSTFRGVTKKWVYYYVPLKETGERKSVKLFYDRNYDWDFEDDRG